MYVFHCGFGRRVQDTRGTTLNRISHERNVFSSLGNGIILGRNDGGVKPSLTQKKKTTGRQEGRAFAIYFSTIAAASPGFSGGGSCTSIMTPLLLVLVLLISLLSLVAALCSC